MKKAIAVVLILAFMVMCFSGCSKLESASATIESIAGMKSYEVSSTITLGMDISELTWVNPYAYKILESITKAPFTLTTKVVNSGAMEGKALIGITASDMELECYYDYDFRDSDNLKFRIVIPTKNLNQYFGLNLDKEYVWIDAAKSAALSRYLPILMELHEKHQILKYPNIFYTVLNRGSWEVDGDAYKLAASDEFFKARSLEIFDEACEQTELLEKLRVFYRLPEGEQDTEIKAAFYNTVGVILNTRFVTPDGVKYELKTASGRKISSINSEGNYLFTVSRVMKAFGSTYKPPNDDILFSVKTETEFSSINGTKIQEKYEMTENNSTNITSVFDSTLESMKNKAFEQEKMVVSLDGKKINFPTEAKPFGLGGTTMVPAHILAAEIGAMAQEDAENLSLTISKNDTTLMVKNSSIIATVNDAELEMSMGTVYVDNIYFIPLKTVTDTFGIDIDFSESDGYKTINLTTKK